MKGTLYIISGPSGVGKSTLIKQAVSQLTLLEQMVSYTTREKRPHEQDGVDYHFVSSSTFERLLAEDELIGHLQFGDYHYGTSKKALDDKLKQGCDLILDLDYLPARKIRTLFQGCISIFILPRSEEVLRQRLIFRQESNIESRIKKSRQVIPHYMEYGHVIFNDENDLPGTLSELVAIIRANRTKIMAQECINEESFTALGLKGKGLTQIHAVLNSIPATATKNKTQLQAERLNGWGNNPYKIFLSPDEIYFLRLPRDGSFVDRANEKNNLDTVAKLGFYPAYIHFDENSGIYLAPFIPNQGTLTPELLKKEETIIAVAQLLKRVHQTETSLLTQANPLTKAKTLLTQAKNFQTGVSQEEKTSSPSDRMLLISELESMFEEISATQQLLTRHCQKLAYCHNDVNPYNFLRKTEGLLLTDWEHAGLNDPFWDLATLSIEAELTAEQDNILLKHYQHGYSIQGALARLTLYKPLVEFWLSTWLLNQLSIDNDAVPKATFEAVLKKRRQHCEDLLKSIAFKTAGTQLKQSSSIHSTSMMTGAAAALISAGALYGLFAKKYTRIKNSTPIKVDEHQTKPIQSRL